LFPLLHTTHKSDDNVRLSARGCRERHAILTNCLVPLVSERLEC
jgi:hypothetical protein